MLAIRRNFALFIALAALGWLAAALTLTQTSTPTQAQAAPADPADGIVMVEVPTQVQSHSQNITLRFNTQTRSSWLEGAQLSDSGMELSAQVSGAWVSQPIAVPLDSATPFLDVGSVWRVSTSFDQRAVRLSLRASVDGATWGDWFEHDHIHEIDANGIYTHLNTFEPATRYVQFRVVWDANALSYPVTLYELQVAFINPDATPQSTLDAIATARRPIVQHNAASVAIPPIPVVTRTAWGCPQGQGSNWTPEYTDVTHFIIHHTVSNNGITDWAAHVRSLWEFHTYTNGWGDIGYNYLIDPNGVIYEGRAGGDGAIGAHFCGKNSNTMGVGMLGDFTYAQPSTSAIASLERLLAWKAAVFNLDPLASTYHPQSGYDLNAISGHRDGCSTSCPGNGMYALIPGVRANVDLLVTYDIAPENRDLVVNGNFDNDFAGWEVETGTDYAVYNGENGTYLAWKALPNVQKGVIMQTFGYGIPADNTLGVDLLLGNNSGVPKQVDVTLHEVGTWAGSLVCTFNIPPNTPLQTYVMRGATNREWSNTRLYIEARPGDGVPDILTDAVRVRRYNYDTPSTQCMPPSNNTTWDFSTSPASGWVIASNLENPQPIAGGTYYAINGGDPYLKGPEITGVNAANYPYVAVRIASQTATCGQVYFTTQSAPTFDEAKSKTFQMTNDGGLYTYFIDMSTVAGWQGTLKQLRLDPACDAGEWIILNRVWLANELPPEAITRIAPQGNVAAPALTLSWQHDPLADWYQVYIINNDTGAIMDQWFAATEADGSPYGAAHVCTAGVCTVPPSISNWWLSNGAYQWWVAGWNFADMGVWDITPMNFNFDHSPPTNVNMIGADTLQAGPTTISWSTHPGAAWYQVWIGTSGDYQSYHFAWHPAYEICTESTCAIALNNLPADDYEIWLMTWGPGGFGSPDGTFSNAAWQGPFTFTKIAP